VAAERQLTGQQPAYGTVQREGAQPSSKAQAQLDAGWAEGQARAEKRCAAEFLEPALVAWAALSVQVKSSMQAEPLVRARVLLL